jgi:hypothetical protein
MDMSLLIVLAGAAAAGFAQGVSGFAFSLVALSIWAWAVEPQLAAPMAVFGALAGQLVALPWVWRGFDLRKLLPLVIGGLMGVPVGAWLLQWLDPLLFRFGLGVFLLVYCPLMLLLPATYVWPHGGRVADGAAGLVGGMLGGLAGMSGPVPTLWTTLRGHAAWRAAGLQYCHACGDADSLRLVRLYYRRDAAHVCVDRAGLGYSRRARRIAVSPAGHADIPPPDFTAAVRFRIDLGLGKCGTMGIVSGDGRR